MNDDEKMTKRHDGVDGPTARAKSFTVPRWPDQWHKLPLKLRQRWWRETDYGKRAPSDDLVKAIQEVLHDVTPEKP